MNRSLIVRWMLAGLGAGCVLTAVMLALRLWLNVPSLPEQIQEQLLLLIPGPLFSAALERLEFSAKPLMFVVLVIALIGAAGVVGVGYGLAQRRLASRIDLTHPLIGAAIGLVLWISLERALLPLFGVTSLSTLAYGVSRQATIAMQTLPGLAFGLTLAWLGRTAVAADGRRGDHPRATESMVSRRAVAVSAVPAVAALVTLWTLRRIIGGMRQPEPAAEAFVIPSSTPQPSPTPTATTAVASQASEATATAPERTPRAALTTPTAGAPSPTVTSSATPTVAPPVVPPQVAAAITPNEAFYVVSKNFVDPTVDPSAWRLEIAGLVDNPFSLMYDELLALPTESSHVTLECISNRVGGKLMSSTLWTGVPLHVVLERAALRLEATTIAFTSADNYVESFPLDKATAPTTLLVHTMNGEPLPDKHGFPLRVLSTGRYGMKNPKWLVKIEAMADDVVGYWSRRQWSPDGPVKTTTRIDVPQDGASLPASRIDAGGIAFAGDRGISRLELSADGGATWMEARIEPPLSPFTWVRWGATWTPPGPGSYEFVARAYEADGTPQVEEAHSSFPGGATGYHRVTVRIGE